MKEIASAGGGSLLLRLRGREQAAIDEAMRTIGDRDADAKARVELIRLAGELQLKELPNVLFDVTSSDVEAEVMSASMAALQTYADPKVASWAVDNYASLNATNQKLAQELLASRLPWVRAMLDGIENEDVDPLSISIETVRKCLLLAGEDAELRSAIESRWGEGIAGETTETMKQEVARLSTLLNNQAGDVYQGQKLFRSNCGKCHKLFIDGGDIGPDLTTYQRSDVSTMALNIVNPSAEIREGFENYLVLTDEGRLITGLMVDRDNKVVVLRSAEGQTVTIDRDSIEESRVLGRSLMPEGLLNDLSDEQIIDLFAYLRSTQPLNN